MDGTPCEVADREKECVSIQTCYSVKILLAVHDMNYSLLNTSDPWLNCISQTIMLLVR